MDYAPSAVSAEALLAAVREVGFRPRLVAEFEKPNEGDEAAETAPEPLPPREEIPGWLLSRMDAAREAGHTLVLDFRADWCTPCVRMERVTFVDPTVEERLARDVELVSVDVDEHPDAAAAFGVESIPHLVVVAPDGSLRARRSGFHDPAAFLALLDD